MKHLTSNNQIFITPPTHAWFKFDSVPEAQWPGGPQEADPLQPTTFSTCQDGF